MQNFIVLHIHMFTYGGSNQSCALTTQLAHYNIAHNVAICLVQVRNRLVEEQKINGLTQRPNQRHALLLAKGHPIDPRVELVANAQLLKPLRNPLLGLVARELVLYLHILQSREFAKELEILEKRTQRPLAQPTPLLHCEP